MPATSLVADLQSVVGAEYVRAPIDDDRADIDGLRPSIIVEPRTYKEVGAIMRIANDEGLAVIPLGLGEFRSIGNIPDRYDIALGVSRLSSIVEYEPADLTLTCQAGATLEGLHRALNKNGQMVPFGSGPARMRIARLLSLPPRGANLPWGSARDFTIGLRVVMADGSIIRTGGNVVKNVAGYDLTKLFIGSMGTLGVIVEATFKLAPAPQAGERLAAQFSSLVEACQFAHELCKRGLSVWHVGIDRPMSVTEAGESPLGYFRTTVYLAGSSRAVERSRTEAVQLAASTGVELQTEPTPKREGPPPSRTSSGEPLTCQSTVLPTLVPAFIEEVDQIAPGASLDVAPLQGSISCTWLGAGADEDVVRRLRAAATRLGGSLIVTGCDLALKRQIDVFGEVPPKTLDLMRRIKQQFDPNGILSPGRFVGKL